jgi:hypothetical protein
MIKTLLTSSLTILALSVTAPSFGQPIVVVNEYGEAPREELRYRYTAGEEQQATMTMEMSMSMGDSAPQGMVMPAMPAIRIPVSIRTTEVLGDGSARFEAIMGAPTLVEDSGANPLRQMLGPAMSMIDGAATYAWVDARGHTLDAQFEMPGTADPMLAQMMSSVAGSFQGQMQQMSAPFPAEALGVGARWRVTTAVQLMGVATSMNADYTLLARNSDIVELEVSMTQTVDPNASSVPGMEAWDLAALANLSNQASGSMTVDLGNAIAHSEITTEQSMAMGAAGGAGTTPMMSMRMTISPQNQIQ